MEKKEREEFTKFNHYPKDNIVTTLDTVLDTRFGLLYNINKDLAIKMLATGGYHTRVRDNFGALSQDVFRSIYRYRNKNILEFGIPTIVLTTLIFYLIRGTLDSPHKGGDVQPLLYINYHPYELTEQEIKRLAIMISSTINLSSDFVKFVKLDYDQFTPKWINENAHTMILYDGIDWLEYQVAKGRLTHDPLVGTNLFVPFLLSGTLTTNSIDEARVESYITMYKPIVNLEFVDANYFCFMERNEEQFKKKTESK